MAEVLKRTIQVRREQTNGVDLSKYTQYIRRVITSLPYSAFLFIIISLTKVSAQNTTESDPYPQLPPGFNVSQCVVETDNYVGNAQAVFHILPWAKRGRCVRSGSFDYTCYATLNNILEFQINELRKAEYSGAAGVLALLPTIGALLGAPTNEIWRLLTLVPFGGVVAMFLSFGSAILPVKAGDYEIDFSRRRFGQRGRETTIGGWYQTQDDGENGAQNDHDPRVKARKLERLVRERLRRSESQHIPTTYIWYGLCGMIILLLAAHAAMAIVEQGAVLPWWCVSRWWMHLWYFLVTLTAITDNYVQLPFKHQWKLFVSDIPYTVSVTGGEDITNWMLSSTSRPLSSSPNNPLFPTTNLRQDVNHVQVALRQLGTFRTGTVSISGSTQRARCRNNLIVMVSVIDDNSHVNSFFKAVSKLCAIGVFVTGTAFFASAQLLALPMAVMVLTLVLGAGVFGRTMAGWIVTGIEQCEPMVHFIAGSTEEAADVIRRILTLDVMADEGDVEAGGRYSDRDPSSMGVKTVDAQEQVLSRGDRGSDFNQIEMRRLDEGITSTVAAEDEEEDLKQYSQGYDGGAKAVRGRGPYRKIQVEIQGHIFVDMQRVTRRSVWPLRVMGILCRPFDLGNSRL